MNKAAAAESAMAGDCIFCRIASGDIQALRVRETEHTLAFLDINPLAPGHTLLIPKLHIERIEKADPEQLAWLARELPLLARAVSAATQASGLNVLQNNGRSAGQAVFHLHFHLIPREDGDTLGYRWNAGSYAPSEADAMLERIRAELGT